MATNFPNTSEINPDTGVVWADGDAFDDTGDSGLIYYWYDPVWNTEFRPTAASDARYVEVAGDTMTGDLTVPSLNGGPLAGFRNLIINGDFRIWQRGDGPFDNQTDPNQYGPDRWYMGMGASNPSEFRKYVSTGSEPFEFGLICESQDIDTFARQKIEGNPFIAGESYTLSLISDSTEGLTQFTLQAVASGTVVAQMVETSFQSEDLGGGFTKYISTAVIPADFSNKDIDHVSLTTGVGDSSRVGKILAQIQIERGPVATPFEHRPIGTELALCQRYFQKWQLGPRDNRFFTERDAASGNFMGNCELTTPMRIYPHTATFGNDADWNIFAGAAYTMDGRNLNARAGYDTLKDVNRVGIILTSDALATYIGGSWQIISIRSNSDTLMPYVLFDAEL